MIFFLIWQESELEFYLQNGNLKSLKELSSLVTKQSYGATFAQIIEEFEVSFEKMKKQVLKHRKAKGTFVV
jgi:hypothetical protein